MKVLKKIGIFFSLALLTACENSQVYHSYHNLGKQGWSKSDTLTFDLSITDSLAANYTVYVLVRNNTDYKYRDLRLAVNHNFPDTISWKTDTLVIPIADAAGKWLGKGLSGLYESILPMDSSSAASKKDFVFKVSSLMEADTITGINDIGILAR